MSSAHPAWRHAHPPVRGALRPEKRPHQAPPARRSTSPAGRRRLRPWPPTERKSTQPPPRSPRSSACSSLSHAAPSLLRTAWPAACLEGRDSSTRGRDVRRPPPLCSSNAAARSRKGPAASGAALARLTHAQARPGRPATRAWRPLHSAPELETATVSTGGRVRLQAGTPTPAVSCGRQTQAAQRRPCTAVSPSLLRRFRHVLPSASATLPVAASRLHPTQPVRPTAGQEKGHSVRQLRRQAPDSTPVPALCRSLPATGVPGCQHYHADALSQVAHRPGDGRCVFGRDDVTWHAKKPPSCSPPPPRVWGVPARSHGRVRLNAWRVDNRTGKGRCVSPG